MLCGINQNWAEMVFPSYKIVKVKKTQTTHAEQGKKAVIQIFCKLEKKYNSSQASATVHLPLKNFMNIFQFTVVCSNLGTVTLNQSNYFVWRQNNYNFKMFCF